MIRRCADAVVTLGVGLAAGWLLSGMVSSEPASESGPAPAVNPARATNPALTPPAAASAGKAPAAVDTDDCLDTAVGSTRTVYPPQKPLPEAYLDMIPMVAEGTSTSEPYDRYAAFASDPRDEPWAAAMEAGINNRAARADERETMVLDYVECRSHFCMIAGHSTTGQTAPLANLPGPGW